jgi:tRNA (guanine-N7-)-methyltransferase
LASDKPELPKTIDGKPRAFFGRRSGKRLHRGQDQLFREVLPGLRIELGETPLDLRALFPGKARHGLEIGYGGGEHLALEAERNPETGFIGAEVFSGGIAKMLEAIDTQGLDNVRLYTDDALKLLEKLPEASLEIAFLLYPDPWPKTRHHKRRFVSAVTLAELARVLRPGGTFHFASDIADYADWTLAHVLGEPRFRFEAGAPGSWHQPFPRWQPTRYEEKARVEGRMLSSYFTFRRV